METGPTPPAPLYPTMTELRWSLIRKVYSIVAIQLLLTVAVGAVVVTFRHPIVSFFTTTNGGFRCYIVILLTPFITLIPFFCNHQWHPINYVLLGIFTISLAFAVGLSCASSHGKVILETAILGTVVVVSSGLYYLEPGGAPAPDAFRLSSVNFAIFYFKILYVLGPAPTIYDRLTFGPGWHFSQTPPLVVSLTFWAAKRGYDFNFLGPFLFGALMVLSVFGFIQILFPLGKLPVMIYGCLAALIFCGYIVYDTGDLIKRYTYDDYIWAAISLYLDIINLFMALLAIFSGADSGFSLTHMC